MDRAGMGTNDWGKWEICLADVLYAAGDKSGEQQRTFTKTCHDHHKIKRSKREIT